MIGVDAAAGEDAHVSHADAGVDHRPRIDRRAGERRCEQHGIEGELIIEGDGAHGGASAEVAGAVFAHGESGFARRVADGVEGGIGVEAAPEREGRPPIGGAARALRDPLLAGTVGVHVRANEARRVVPTQCRERRTLQKGCHAHRRRGRSPPHFTGVDHRDADARLGEHHRRRQAGDAGTDDDDIVARVGLERRRDGGPLSVPQGGAHASIPPRAPEARHPLASVGGIV